MSEDDRKDIYRDEDSWYYCDIDKGWFKLIDTGDSSEFITEYKNGNSRIELNGNIRKYKLKPGVIPNNVTYIEIFGGIKQKLPIGFFPNSIEHINMGDYNLPLEVGIFPNSVERIDMRDYNFPLEVGIFPDSVKRIELGFNFNHPLTEGVLPNSLKILTIGNNGPQGEEPPIVNQPKENIVLPSSVKFVVLSYVRYDRGTVEFNERFTVIGTPYESDSDSDIEYDSGEEVICDTDVVEYICEDYEGKLCICFPDDFNRILKPSEIPDGVIKVHFNYFYTEDIPNGVFPDSVKYINFEDGFNQQLSVDFFPNFLEEVVLGIHFNYPIEYGVLPKTLKKLTIGANTFMRAQIYNLFNQPKENIILPPSIESVTIPIEGGTMLLEYIRTNSPECDFEERFTVLQPVAKNANCA